MLFILGANGSTVLGVVIFLYFNVGHRMAIVQMNSEYSKNSINYDRSVRPRGGPFIVELRQIGVNGSIWIDLFWGVCVVFGD